MSITATELKNNLGKYLLLSAKEDVFITKNGKIVAKLTKSQHSTRDYPVMMSKAVTQSTGGYEKKDKNGNPT